MNKLLPIALLLTLLLTACGGTTTSSENSGANTNSPGASQSEDTFVYESENGPVTVPKNPQRVVVLTRFLTGNVMLLDVPLVGVDQMAKDNPNFAEQLKDVEVVSDESLEKILALQPDLIIGQSNISNLDKLNEIAPTVTYTYGKLDYLQQHIEIGKLLNKEAEAKAWAEDFQARATEAGENIRAKVGDDATVSVIEMFNKQLYVYGYNFGRGTEILYGEMGLKLPEKVEEATQTDGYLALSFEVMGDYMGDYVIYSKDEAEDNSFLETETYKSIDAVKNNRVFTADAKAFYFNDPLSLEYQLQFFIDHFLDGSEQ